ncbi:hypothetical protein NDU88_002949 [Pleurodeles waltl]|uniref:Uncharacterized protein n=1 Tax=Pleurodeles waltl TaxID=8319 RepID=A0AAV7QBD6_PLEWA|nr:hypothetical protein NDU88_002949 [Pleurodeles waltl]
MLRDRRARRLQMASTSTGHREFEEQGEEEEAFSIHESDSEEFDVQETVSKTSKPAHKKTDKAQGTPLPTGHGSTHKIGDRPSAPKKAELVPRSSDSGRDTGTQQSRDRESAADKDRRRDSGAEAARRRDSSTEEDRRREVSTPKKRKVASEPKTSKDIVSVPKRPATEPTTSSYSEEQSLSSQLRKHRFEEELQSTEVDHTQKRIFIQSGTGKISTLPPIRRKRRLEFQTQEQAPQTKVVKKVTPPPSPPPVTHISPAQTPSHSPAHTTMSQDDQDAWDLYDAPVSDNSPEAYPTKPSPPEDSTAYSQVVARAAEFHNVSLHSEPVEDDFLFNTLSSTHSTYQSLPMLPGMLRHAKQIFKEPVKSRAITPSVEKKYKAPPTDPAFITSQLPPDSVVVGAARKRANSHTSGDAPPPDKESRKFDAAGKRVAVQAANQWRIANSQALLARYDRAHWDEMQHLIEHLPKDLQKRAKQVVEEGQNISNNQIRSSMDAADTAARTINTAVTIRRDAWLRTSGFKPEIQQAVLNMPFNEQQLFGPEVDTAIEKLKKDTDTAKAMGALYSPQGRGTFGTFCKTTFRGGFRGQATQASTSHSTPSTYQGQYQRGGFQGQYRGGQLPRNRGKFQSP